MDSAWGYRLVGFAMIGAFFVGAQLYGRTMRRMNAAAHPGLVLSAIAQTLGLSIVRGDPTFHLVNGGSRKPLWMLIGAEKYDVDLLLEGASQGRPVSLSIVDRHFSLRNRFIKYENSEYRSALAVGGIRSAVRFEAWLETSNEYVRARPRLGLPIVHRVAVPAGTLVVSAESTAGLAPVVPLLEHLAVSLHYLHLVGEGGTLELVLTRIGLHTVAPELAGVKEAMLTIAGAMEQGAGATASPAPAYVG